MDVADIFVQLLLIDDMWFAFSGSTDSHGYTKLIVAQASRRRLHARHRLQVPP